MSISEQKTLLAIALKAQVASILVAAGSSKQEAEAVAAVDHELQSVAGARVVGHEFTLSLMGGHLWGPLMGPEPGP